MKLLIALITLLYALSAEAAVTISAPAGPSTISIKTSDNAAGAICSLTWYGRQFIDAVDHGRCLQSAASFDGKGEYFNPTEGGSAPDGLLSGKSSSVLRHVLASGNALTTTAQGAYWFPVDGAALSGTRITKRVRIGLPGMAHVIEYLTEFEVPPGESHATGTFEAVTGYMPTTFTRFFTFDVKGGAATLVPLNDGPGEQDKPIIFSDASGVYAMGVYSPDSPQGSHPEAGYGRWRFGDTVKWNNVFRVSKPVGTLRFRSYVIVGSLDNVRVSMIQLHRSMPLYSVVGK